MERYVHDEHETDATISRPVTERSRITGTERTPLASRSGRSTDRGTGIDWGAVTASVLTGQAVTATLIILGISTGLIAGNEGTGAEGALGILAGIGAWAVVAMLVGAFVGGLLGGRLARWLDRGTLAYHALASWGLSTIVSVLMVCLVAIAFASTTTSAAATAAAAEQVTEGQATAGTGAAATAPAAGEATAGQQAGQQGEQAADDAGDALGGAGVALTLGMLLSLAAAFGGWWVGSRKRLTDFEREDDSPRVAVA